MAYTFNLSAHLDHHDFKASQGYIVDTRPCKVLSQKQNKNKKYAVYKKLSSSVKSLEMKSWKIFQANGVLQ